MSEPKIQNETARPFLATIDALEGRSEEFANRVGFSREVLERPEDRLPERCLFEISRLAADELARPDFGLIAGLDSELGSLGRLGATAEQSLTLFDAIHTFARGLSRVSSHSHWWSESRSDALWFCRDRIDGCEAGEMQAELYVVGLMTRISRLALGDDWNPEKVDLQDSSGGRDHPLSGVTEPRMGQPSTGIAIPVRDLHRPVTRCVDSEFAAELRGWLSGRNKIPTIQEASEEQRVSPRSLQRLLAQQGLTYRRLIDQERFAHARQVLEETDARLADLAFALGYAEQAHFTRAFRRWTGVTPGAYRQLLLETA